METKESTPARLPVLREKQIEIEQMQINLLGRVISDPDLKTQMTATERILLPELIQIFEDAFPISRDIAKVKYPNANLTKERTPLLFSFPFGAVVVKEYKRSGKALDRKGIREDTDMIHDYFAAKEAEAHAQAKLRGWEK